MYLKNILLKNILQKSLLLTKQLEYRSMGSSLKSGGGREKNKVWLVFLSKHCLSSDIIFPNKSYGLSYLRAWKNKQKPSCVATGRSTSGIEPRPSSMHKE